MRLIISRIVSFRNAYFARNVIFRTPILHEMSFFMGFLTGGAHGYAVGRLEEALELAFRTEMV